MRDAADRFVSTIRGSQTLRLLAVGFLALLLQIPIAMISGLVSERQQRRGTAVAEVSSAWGNAQSITGPALVVPYAHRWTEAVAAGPAVTRTETRHAVFLPERLRIRGNIDSEIRSRGIFSVPVYKLGLVVDGTFAPPRFADLGIDPATVYWDRAHLAIGISDARAIQEATTLTWNGRPIGFLPATGGFAEAGAGIHAVVGPVNGQQPVDFSFPLSLNGSLRTDVVPFGQQTVVEIRSDHPHPSFRGNWLPTQRTVTDNGFEATWNISFLGRSYPQAWTSTGIAAPPPPPSDFVAPARYMTTETTTGSIDGSRFGVELVDPVDHYRMAERSVKYAGLFILLTFALVWLIEVLAGVRVHAIQYLMLGGALCLFYLLELSLSEHLGFPVAYLLASVAVIGMVAAYSAFVLRRATRAVTVGAAVAALYAYLYLVLMNEDYALLIGSIGLFAMLGAIMFATRRVNWYTVGARSAEVPVANR